MIELLRTNDAVVLSFVQSLLRDSGIDCLLADQNMSHQVMVTTLYVISGLALAVAVAAVVFAVLLFRRRRWAWYALLTSAGAAALLFLAVAVSQPASLLLVVAAATTIACLVRPEVRAWLLRR